MFVYVGLLIALVQGGMVRRLAPKVGEKKLVLVGLFLILPAFGIVAFARATWQLYLGLFPMAVGSAFVMPCLSALVSRYTPPERQGITQGTFRALGSLSRAIGPFLGGMLFWKLGSGAPFWAGALLVLVPLALAARLPAPREHEETAPAS